MVHPMLFFVIFGLITLYNICFKSVEEFEDWALGATLLVAMPIAAVVFLWYVASIIIG